MGWDSRASRSNTTHSLKNDRIRTKPGVIITKPLLLFTEPPFSFFSCFSITHTLYLSIYISISTWRRGVEPKVKSRKRVLKPETVKQWSETPTQSKSDAVCNTTTDPPYSTSIGNLHFVVSYRIVYCCCTNPHISESSYALCSSMVRRVFFSSYARTPNARIPPAGPSLRFHVGQLLYFFMHLWHL